MPKDIPKRCYHSFSVKENAIRYAKLGARNCQAVTIVIDMITGKEVIRIDCRVN